jgi:alpha,alpha-trehalase
VGMPFEVQQDILMMFWAILKKYNLLVREFEKQYLNRTFVDAELDEYFIHDRVQAKAFMIQTDW